MYQVSTCTQYMHVKVSALFKCNREVPLTHLTCHFVPSSKKLNSVIGKDPKPSSLAYPDVQILVFLFPPLG